MNILGIDFGTTKTLAARWDERSQMARLIRLGRSGDAIPTTIYADKSGKLEFGEDADDMRALDSAGWKARIKRDLGKDSSVVLNGNPHRVVDLIASYLAYILKRAEEEVFYSSVDLAIITVPALYGPAEREELKGAAAKAGFKQFKLLDEPVAAGLAFLHDKTGTELGEAILVFDWGGGTLDLALVESQDGEFRVNHRWIGGDKNLGGEDIDDSVIEGVDGLCSKEHGRVDEQEDQNRLHIQRNLKEGKELLSRRSEHTFRLMFKQPIEFKWSREDFETFTAFTVNRALDCLRDLVRKLESAGIKPTQVLLVGGASSMPVIKRRIEEELHIKPILWENSQTAVALGAATYAVRSFSSSQPVATSSVSRPPQVQAKYSREVIAAPPNPSSQPIAAVSTSFPPQVQAKYSREVIAAPPNTSSQPIAAVRTNCPPKVPKEYARKVNEQKFKEENCAQHQVSISEIQPSPKSSTHSFNSKGNHDNANFTNAKNEEILTKCLDPFANDEPATASTNFTKIRNKYVWREYFVKLIAVLFLAVFTFSLFVCISCIGGDFPIGRNDAFILTIINILFLIVLISVYRLSNSARWIFLVISSPLLILFPIGTLIWLLLLYPFGSSFLFSADYKVVIAATPQIKVRWRGIKRNAEN